MKFLSNDKYYDDTTHADYFELYWDNDVVSLKREDVEALIPILQKWLQLKH